ncbi:UNVERIFIED_CONTAM: hypothetical protein PYX00_008995 [Menopon gallinae]|uniref:SH3 domain-containing protein n=1 Tax=Menopon gallinae TaxID=328185 RepID=A0AAW2H9P8_9NEOP
MAFLCPVRIGRSKKKKTSADIDKDVSRGPGMGRITGSASIETLVRVGIEKENGLSPDSKMVILHDFTPCVDDELEVKRGQIVNILYRENDWVYVIAQDTRQEGFIPHSYCTPFTSYQHLMELKKKLPREVDSDGEEYGQVTVNSANSVNNNGNSNNSTNNNSSSSNINNIASAGNNNTSCGNNSTSNINNGNSSCNNKNSNHANNNSNNSTSSNSSVSSCNNNNNNNHKKKTTIVQMNLTSSQASLHSAGSSQPEIHPFSKDPSGRYIVLYTFIARDENDVSVERGEFVTVLNREDPDWFWIVRSDGQEGFVPSGFVYPADVIQGHLNESVNSTAASAGAAQLNYANGSFMGHQTSEDLKYHGTELVMLYDYKAQAPDDLFVRRGDWIYADMNNQTVDGWLWAYAPKTRKYGFIPKAYARPPAMTSL